MKNQTDIIKMANAMQRERDAEQEFKRYFPLVDFVGFEQSFNDIFAGDEVQVKPVNTSQALIAAGHSIHDF